MAVVCFVFFAGAGAKPKLKLVSLAKKRFQMCEHISYDSKTFCIITTFAILRHMTT